jgi:hypothetical protein
MCVSIPSASFLQNIFLFDRYLARCTQKSRRYSCKAVGRTEEPDWRSAELRTRLKYYKEWSSFVVIKYTEKHLYPTFLWLRRNADLWAHHTLCAHVCVCVSERPLWTSWPSFIKLGMNVMPFVGFEVFTAVVMKSIIFWDVTPCSLLSCNRRFGRIYRLHLQGRRNNFSKNQQVSRWQAIWPVGIKQERTDAGIFRCSRSLWMRNISD